MEEKRLIDANSILDDFLKRYTDMERDGKIVFSACEIKQDFADMISNATTVDAVEVVRCRDCAKLGLFTCPICFIENKTLQFVNISPDFYCGEGERKDGDKDYAV